MVTMLCSQLILWKQKTQPLLVLRSSVFHHEAPTPLLESPNAQEARRELPIIYGTS